jgi:hypothetical protein
VAPFTPSATAVRTTPGLQGKIGRCDLMIVLVGSSTGSSRQSSRKSAWPEDQPVFFGVRLTAAGPTDCQSIGLPPNRIVAYDWGAIDSAVAQLLTEGKHHKFV